MDRSTGRALALALPALLCACSTPPKPTILSVGPGMAFALPSQAARMAKPGDVIQITAGTYSDCARLDTDGLVMEGLGSGATLTGTVCDDKGFFVTRGRNITVRNITFLGARSSSHNGAGIRAEGAGLTVENSRFIDNDDGILTNDNPLSTITIKNSRFKGNGNCIGYCAHGIYAGHIGLLRVENSEFEEQHVGHHIKSRAARTEILNTSVTDGPDGSASYLVDLPNGGSALISGNRFEKGPRSENKNVAISIGAEGTRPENPPGEIVIKDNAFENDTGGPTVFVMNHTGNSIQLGENRLGRDITPLRGLDDRASVRR